MASKVSFIPRVDQLDAIQLDKDVHNLLREQLCTPIQNYAPHIYLRFHPEINLLLDAVVWFASVGRRMSTFGQDILLISYDKDRLTTSRLCLHFILTVIPKYIRTNSEQRFVNKKLLSQAITVVENAALGLSMLNFFRFLKTGSKPSLVDFLLGLDYVGLGGRQRRNIGYKIMTRELLWGGYMELLGLLLPMINFYKLRRFATDLVRRAKPQSSTVIEPQFDEMTTCVYCNERPTIPHHMGCGHIFCYYCLQANLLTDPEFRCPVCQSKKIKVMLLKGKEELKDGADEDD